MATTLWGKGDNRRKFGVRKGKDRRDKRRIDTGH
jgi:hypothetical protein